MKFKLKSKYAPAGDQPKAIDQLVFGLQKGYQKQTLLGVTGSGKTFTMANVIEKVQKPTLVIAHNKTLAAQLCNEFREFFPDNAVEYFVSYYDYYQPEAYMPNSDTYIEKEAQINQEIDRLRHACTQALLTRKDVIIVASVSAIYGLGSPKEYEKIVLHVSVNDAFDHRKLSEQLINMHFERTNADLTRGHFRLHGQVLEIMPVNEEKIYRFTLSEKVEQIQLLDPITKQIIKEVPDAWFFPAKHYIAGAEAQTKAVELIKNELSEQLKVFKKEKKLLEEDRLSRRVRYDLELIKNIGYCNGIENYSRHFDGRDEGEAPFTLLDYFARGTKEFLTIIDESHVTVPQIRGMYFGDKSRKDMLVAHGFRLPSCRDNRPLKFDEFEKKVGQVIYTSATPAEFELTNSQQIAEQIVRPTGLIDSEIVVRPITGKNNYSQISDLIVRIEERVKINERTLVTTLTKKMAEDLTDYLKKKKIKVAYLHSDVDTLERIQIITDLRRGEIDVLIGVNLLREGLDMPEVSLVAILDADKQGFLRSETSLIQTIGRAARNINGQVLLYADNITDAIKKAMSETARRRKIQLAYNKKNHITPKTIEKEIKNILEDFGLHLKDKSEKKSKSGNKISRIAQLDLLGDARPMKEIIAEKEAQMRQAAKDLEFELAALLRDEIYELKKQQTNRSTDQRTNKK
ncbi:MAG: excinuclease ABC subunit UvrB [Patescibacteria group bacterium]